MLCGYRENIPVGLRLEYNVSSGFSSSKCDTNFALEQSEIDSKNVFL